MHKFGEMCIDTFKDNTHWAKLANQGTPCIWVGYTENHPTGTHRIFNPKTKRIILTRDVTFLKKSYGAYNKLWGVWWWGGTRNIFPVDNKNNYKNVVSDSDIASNDDDFENNEENFFDKDINDQLIASPKTTINAKVIQAMNKLKASYNYNANKIIKDATQIKVSENLNFLIDLALVTTKTMPVPEEPASFN